ncbi:carboxypeptidase-like regulatory domain-containing protein [Tenacibaculum amylolyticum]|uniref:carboxypeptidase-like regulatory domain-containing protein n=1 Tax=Tenacibaculum amylolyticum TaxID=104269 RepID=UPI003895FC64
MQKLLLYLILITTFQSFGQRIEITGTLSDKTGKIINAHIVNITSQQGTFSDDNGNFSIKVQLNDELKITSVQHHTKNITVANVFLKQKKIDIQLHLKDYLLDEVEIKRTNLSGILTSDIKGAKETKREEVMKNLGFNPYVKKKSQIEREIYGASTSAGLIPLDLIINTFSGRMAMLKKKKMLLENEQKMQAIERKYRSHITLQLKIDSTDVARFIYFVHQHKDFKKIYQKGDFDLIPFLKEQALLFKKDSL